MADVKLNYVPRKQFLDYHRRKERWAVLITHRRAGKTTACLADLLGQAIQHPLHSEALYAYIAPYHNQAKDIAWKILQGMVRDFGSSFVKIDRSELSITLWNGATIRLYGAENYARLRGLGLHGVVLDEYGDIDPEAWDTVIRACLSDHQGFCTFSGTPKGHNELYNLWTKGFKAIGEGREVPLFKLMLKASETNILPWEELEFTRAQMTKEAYEQEYECSFEAAIPGSIYGNLIEESRDYLRINSIPWDKTLPVYTAWDWGHFDDTSIIFYQQFGRELRAIDFYGSRLEDLSHYIKIVKEKPYTYNKHFAPHDFYHNQGLGTKYDAALKLGIKFHRVPEVGIEDGINNARLLFNRILFDKDKCKYLIDALSAYRRKLNKITGELEGPIHDWSSHAADAFRYMCLAYNEPQLIAKKSIVTASFEGSSSSPNSTWLGI